MPITFWNQERLANTTSTGDQQELSVAALSNGNTVAVWTDFGPEPNLIRLQRFDAFGVPVGSEVTVGVAGAFGNPQVAALPDGRFAVAFLSSATNISIQRFLANGSADGPSIVATANASNIFFQPFDFIGLANNTYALAYANGGGERDVFLRIISGAGVVGGEIVVDNGAGSEQASPYLSATAGTLVVTWTDGGANAGDIQMRSFTLTGGVPTTEATVNATTAGIQNFGAITALGGSNHVVVWNDGGTLRGQMVASSGSRLGSEFVIALDYSGTDSAAVAATQEGGFVVVFRAQGGALLAQAFNRVGAPDGAVLRIADSVSSTNAVHVSSLADGRIVVSWAGFGSADAENNGIYTRILDPRDGVVSGDLGSNTLYGNDYGGDQMSGFGGADTMLGLGGDDVMFGGDGGDTMTGGTGNDVMLGEFGADVMSGGAGNDNMDGGVGADAALWDSARSNYVVRSFVFGGQFYTQVVAASGSDGSDTLANIETLAFAGQAFGLAGIQQNLVSNMDGDRFDDVLFQNTATGQVAYLNMTAGAAGGFVSVLGSLPAGWRLVGSDDVSGDGRAEALVQDTNTGSVYTVNIASGSPVWTTVVSGVTSAFQAIASGDVTRDGTADVLIRDTATGQTYIADLNAGGTFGGWLNGPNLGTGWRTVGLGDVNGNGTSDVLLQNTTDGTTYYRDVGNGIWGTVSGAVGVTWVAREAADLNGDSYADVIFRNTASGDIWWVNMLGGVNTGFNVIATGLTGWEVRGSADVDNDGWRDVIVQNTADGTTLYADMNAGVFAGWGTVSGALGTTWVAVG